MKQARIISCVIAIMLVLTAARAQVSTSSVTGVVQDASGAVVPGAKVVVKDEATGTTFETTTTSAGSYAVQALKPGQYTVTISKPGFQTLTSVHNVLEVGAPLVVNASLKVGSESVTVQVESSYERVETGNATVSGLVTEQEVKQLPLNGRNPLNLITLEPGVVQRTTGSAGSGTHVFGSRDRAHNVTIDGIDANESTVPNPQSNIQRLNPDNVQEYRVVTLNATAEMGRNSGANVTVATKSGTNEIHGGVYYFNRNTAYNANEWFSNASVPPLPKADLKLHQWGFDVGGPLKKDKTFWFGSYQGNRILQTQPISAALGGIPTVYTSQARGGMFQFLRGCVNYTTGAPCANPLTPGPNEVASNSPLLVDPNTGALRPGVPVCGGSVSSNCVDTYNIFANDPAGIGGDSAVLGLMGRIPAANFFNQGDGLNTAGYNWNPPSKFVGPHWMIRVDHRFNDYNNIFVRYLQNSYDTLDGDFLNARPKVFPGFPPLGEVLRNGRNLAVSYRHVFSRRLVNEFTAGFNRFRFQFTFGESNKDFPDFTKVFPWADECVFGSFLNIDAPYCLSGHTARFITTPQFIDNLAWTKGGHTLRFGTNIRLYYHNDARGFFGSGILSPIIRFDQNLRTGGFTNLPTARSSTNPQGIDSGDLVTLQQTIVELAGIPARLLQSYIGDFGSNSFVPGLLAGVHTRARQFDFYAQDEWKLRPNLTLNLGLRWEVNPPAFDAGALNHIPSAPFTSGSVGFIPHDSWYDRMNARALGPRLGIAWSPDQKTAVRVGYGLLFDTISTFQVTAVAGKLPGFLKICNARISSTGTVSALTSGCTPPTGTTNRIAVGFPISMPPPTSQPSIALNGPNQVQGIAPNVGAFDPNLKNPAVHEWTLTIQRELPWAFVVQGGYVGKRGTHLYRAYDINQVDVKPEFLAAFNVARQNFLNGCNPDGTSCPPGVTGTPPTLLINMVGASNVRSVLNASAAKTLLRNASVGGIANRIDQLVNISANGFPANYFRPDAQYSQVFWFDSGGDSYYHAGFVELRRRFEKGLTLGLSYTYGKSIDDLSLDPVGAATGGALSTLSFSRTPLDVRNFRLDRSVSDFDNRHVLISNIVWEIPLGRGHTLGGGWPGFLNQILGGWQWTGIYDYQSGEPFSIGSGSFTANGGHVSRADIRGPVPAPKLQFVPGIRGPVLWNVGSLITNPADPNFLCRNVIGTQSYFCIPPPGSVGNTGRNTFYMPNAFWNFDMGVGKRFKMTERMNLEYRAEFFNVFNHPNFENPRNASSGSPTLTSPLFGQTCCVSSSLPSSATVIAIGEPNRVIQFGLKLIF